MPKGEDGRLIREAVGVFDVSETLEAAIHELLTSGFDRAELSLLAGFVGEHHAEYLKQQLRKGRLLLWVRTGDQSHETSAEHILARHSANDVHLNGLAP